MMIDEEKYYQALSQGKMEEGKTLTEQALAAGDAPEKILKESLIKATDRIGVLFKNNEIYIPEVGKGDVGSETTLERKPHHIMLPMP